MKFEFRKGFHVLSKLWILAVFFMELKAWGFSCPELPVARVDELKPLFSRTETLFHYMRHALEPDIRAYLTPAAGAFEMARENFDGVDRETDHGHLRQVEYNAALKSYDEAREEFHKEATVKVENAVVEENLHRLYAAFVIDPDRGQFPKGFLASITSNGISSDRMQVDPVIEGCLKKYIGDQVAFVLKSIHAGDIFYVNPVKNRAQLEEVNAFTTTLGLEPIAVCTPTASDSKADTDADGLPNAKLLSLKSELSYVLNRYFASVKRTTGYVKDKPETHGLYGSEEHQAHQEVADQKKKFKADTGIDKINRGFVLHDLTTWGKLQAGNTIKVLAAEKNKTLAEQISEKISPAVAAKELEKVAEYQKAADTQHYGRSRLLEVDGDADSCWVIAFFMSQVGDGLLNPGRMDRFIKKLESIASEVDHHAGGGHGTASAAASAAPASGHGRLFIGDSQVKNLVDILKLIKERRMNYKEAMFMFNHEKVKDTVIKGMRQVISFYGQRSPGLDNHQRSSIKAQEIKGAWGDNGAFEFLCKHLECSMTTVEDGILHQIGTLEGHRNLFLPFGQGIHYNILVPSDVVSAMPAP